MDAKKEAEVRRFRERLLRLRDLDDITDWAELSGLSHKIWSRKYDDAIMRAQALGYVRLPEGLPPLLSQDDQNKLISEQPGADWNLLQDYHHEVNLLLETQRDLCLRWAKGE